MISVVETRLAQAIAEELQRRRIGEWQCRGEYFKRDIRLGGFHKPYVAAGFPRIFVQGVGRRQKSMGPVRPGRTVVEGAYGFFETPAEKQYLAVDKMHP